jgi:hypothetical protein
VLWWRIAEGTARLRSDSNRAIDVAMSCRIVSVQPCGLPWGGEIRRETSKDRAQTWVKAKEESGRLMCRDSSSMRRRQAIAFADAGRDFVEPPHDSPTTKERAFDTIDIVEEKAVRYE